MSFRKETKNHRSFRNGPDPLTVSRYSIATTRAILSPSVQISSIHCLEDHSFTHVRNLEFALPSYWGEHSIGLTQVQVYSECNEAQVRK